MLGGSSSLNAMFYIRGNRRDFDQWEALGNPSWGWDEVTEFYKKSEDQGEPHIAQDEKYHSTGGYLKVCDFRDVDRHKMIFAECMFELGFIEIFDTVEAWLGFISAQGTIHKGKRVSSAKAFLTPAKDRENLHLVRNALVTKVLINDDNKATGVTFVINDNEFTAKTKKEVIVSAGAINTPQLLILSGVGPKEHLEEHSIKTKVDLPVGKNLQDHAMVPYVLKFRGKELDKMEHADSIYSYMSYGVGYYATIGPTEFTGFISTVNDTTYPDVQLLLSHFEKNSENLKPFLELQGYRDETVKHLLEENKSGDLLMVYSILLNPKSVGSIKIRNSDPKKHPIIDAGYLTDSRDVETLVRSLKILNKIKNTETFGVLEGSEIQLTIPGCDSLDYETDEYWECHVRYLTTTFNQQVGTAKMGPKENASSVVDSRLRVHGVEGLRVVDASVMPLITSGNINTAAIMIGEKGSDFIQKDWAKL